MEFTLDENGKILDNDELYALLDEWYDSDEHEKIALTITAVPREQWSVKLHFRLISAYNNLKRFDDARTELDKIRPECHTPAQQAKFRYMHGYIYFMEDKELMAISCYKDAVAIDPEDTAELELDKEIAECRGYVEKELKKLGGLSERICNDIKRECALKPESEKADITEEEFTMYLGFLSAIRKTPGMERGLGFKNFFTKYNGEDKNKVLKLLEMFGITGRESMLEHYQKDVGCNLAQMYNDVPPYLDGNPNFDLSELNDFGKENFLNAAEFFKPFYKYLPPAGVLAWDLSEKMGFLRLAFSCDMITNSDYCAATMYIREAAQQNFSSFEEYLLSLAFGCGVYMYDCNDWSIVSAMEYMRNMMPLLLNGDLPRVKWLSK